MGFLEEQILNPRLIELFGLTTANQKSDSWLRYLDELFYPVETTLWKHERFYKGTAKSAPKNQIYSRNK